MIDWEQERNRKYHKVSMLFPLLGGKEFDELKQDIQSNGLIEPIWIHQDGSIIDGRNRHRACIETKTEPVFRTWNRQDSLVTFVVSINLHRRHLSSGQRAVVALDILPMLEQEAKERQRQSLGRPQKGVEKIPQVFVPDTGKSRDKAAEITQTNPRYVQDAKKLKSEAPDLLEQVRNGKKTIYTAKRELKERNREQEIQERIASLPKDTNELYDVFCHDIQNHTLDSVNKNSVDFIITDPPYPQEYLHLYGDLIQISLRYLKDGGSLLAMCGQSYLPKIYSMLDEHLNYQWTIAYLTPGGQSVQLWNRKVNCFWKPVIWFTKGTYKGQWIGDVCQSKPNDNDKRYHEWGQSESGMLDLINRFTLPNDTILDPFCGGGTTGVVAIATGRKFIGFDIDMDKVNITKARIQETMEDRYEPS